MLVQEVADPRLEGIFVTDIEVDRELAYANVYISALEGSQRSPEILEGLRHARGYFRSELAQRMELRTFPQLRFHWDPTFERAEKVERLFRQIQEEEQEKEPDRSTEDPIDMEDQDEGIFEGEPDTSGEGEDEDAA